MEFYIRQTNRQVSDLLDEYSSAIWTKKYSGVGDFELYIPASPAVLGLIRPDYYITRLDDSMVGIVEHIVISSTDEEDNAYITVSGRSAESILDRRIVWEQTNLTGRVEECLRRLITENIINPTVEARKIDNFILGDLKGFKETMEMQITGDNLLDAVSKICTTYELGFEVTLNGANQFVFTVIRGVDRSYNQAINPHVVFSPTYDNLLSSEYEKDTSTLKNVALVAGEGEGLARKVAMVGAESGINRRELFVDARDLSSNEGEIPETEYNAILNERGVEGLSETVMTEAFNGEVEPSTTYLYKQDYFVGDIVQIETEYGIMGSPRLWEMTESFDDNGYKLTPVFTTSEV